jgi:hypothetical protein
MIYCVEFLYQIFLLLFFFLYTELQLSHINYIESLSIYIFYKEFY